MLIITNSKIKKQKCVVFNKLLKKYVINKNQYLFKLVIALINKLMLTTILTSILMMNLLLMSTNFIIYVFLLYLKTQILIK